MCYRCTTPARTSRRAFLTVAGAAAVALGTTSSVFAQKPPPKPQNVVDPDEALKLLVSGNRRYVDGTSKRHDFKSERDALTRGQNPYAGILSCANSRIGPEYAFDAGRGDLFVCRVAGNFANDDSVASFEYAIAILNVPLLMVLGHRACGAVEATIKSIKDGTTLPGHLPSLVAALTPAVKAVAGRSRQRTRQRDQGKRPSQCRKAEKRDADHRQSRRGEEGPHRRRGVQPRQWAG